MNLSLIMPTRTADTGMERALESALRQMTKGDELLLITTGSNPNLVKEFHRHSMVKVLEGPSKSRKGDRQRDLAMRAASGDYIAFLDDDDIWLPGARAAIDKAAELYPGRPLMFQLEVKNLCSGLYEPYGKAPTQNGMAPGWTMGSMLVLPNGHRLPTWSSMPSQYSHVDEGMDYHWVTAVLAQLGEPAWIEFPIIRTKVDG